VRRPTRYPECARCGVLTPPKGKNRIVGSGKTKIVCPSCRYDFPTALACFSQGDSPSEIIRSLNIPKPVFMQIFQRDMFPICQGPCSHVIRPGVKKCLHPITGEFWCILCYRKGRNPCGACRRSIRLTEGYIERQLADGAATFMCRKCRAKIVTVKERCSEPGCATPIGPGLERARRHPEDSTRRICARCYARIRGRKRPGFTCAECGKVVGEGKYSYLDPGTRVKRVCGYCYCKLSGYLEARTNDCPLCGEKQPLVCGNPRDPKQRVCSNCFNNISASRKIIELTRTTRIWPRPHQRLFDTALQRGHAVYEDFKTLRGLVYYQPVLPATLDLSGPGLRMLRQSILKANGDSRLPSYHRYAAAAVRRAALNLFGPPTTGQRYRILINRRPLVRPIPAAELLVDFVEKELPQLHYAHSTIQSMFLSLRRFFMWLNEHHPEVYFLRQIQPQHFVSYQVRLGLTASAVHHLRYAWSIFVPFAIAQGHKVTITSLPWEDLEIKARKAPVYSDPRAILQQLDAVVRDEGHDPNIRMLAHLLVLFAPSMDEMCRMRIPMQTFDGIPIVRRSVAAGRCLNFPESIKSRGRQENYRRLSSDSSLFPLRQERVYASLYEAVDEERQATLKGVDCIFLFVSSRQRLYPDIPVSSKTIELMFKKISVATGYSDLYLGLLRNTHALFTGRHVSPRPAVIAAATGRSFAFATTILRSMDLGDTSGLQPLPKIALVSRYGEPFS